MSNDLSTLDTTPAPEEQSSPDHNQEVNSQDLILTHFQEVTGKEDLEECTRLLDECNWDLEKAVQLAFNPTANDPEPIPDPPVELIAPDFGNINDVAEQMVPETFDTAMRQRVMTEFIRPNNQNVQIQGTSIENRPVYGPVGPPNLNRVNRRRQGLIQLLFGYGYSIVSWPFTTLCFIIGSVLNFAYKMFFTAGPPTLRQAGNEVEQYIAEFNSKYGVLHPRFYHGSYREAVSHAKRHLRFLLVFLHDENVPESRDFARDVVCSEFMKQFVEDNLLFWSCSTRTAEGICVAKSLNRVKAPFVGLLCFKDGQMKMVYKHQGQGTLESIITRLTSAVVENETILNRQRSARDRVSESSSSQLIMQEQDSLYQESLLRDQQKAKEKREEEDAVRRVKEEEERAEREYQERKEARRLFREKLRSELEDESKEDCLSLLFRLPNGSRISRKFSPISTIQDVYEFALTCDDSPDYFDLVTNFPKRVLPSEGDCYTKTLNEMQLANASTLFVQEIDSDPESEEEI